MKNEKEESNMRNFVHFFKRSLWKIGEAEEFYPSFLSYGSHKRTETSSVKLFLIILIHRGGLHSSSNQIKSLSIPVRTLIALHCEPDTCQDHIKYCGKNNH